MGVEMTFRVPDNDEQLHHVVIDAQDVNVPDNVPWKEGQEPPKVCVRVCVCNTRCALSFHFGRTSWNSGSRFLFCRCFLIKCLLWATYYCFSFPSLSLFLSYSHPLDLSYTVDGTITVSCYRPVVVVAVPTKVIPWHVWLPQYNKPKRGVMDIWHASYSTKRRQHRHLLSTWNHLRNVPR